MRTRLALVSCLSSLEGAWTLAQGNEAALRVVHLLDGERVRLEVDGQQPYLLNQPGEFPIQIRKGTKYRVCKEVDTSVEVPSPTFAEVLLNG